MMKRKYIATSAACLLVGLAAIVFFKPEPSGLDVSSDTHEMERRPLEPDDYVSKKSIEIPARSNSEPDKNVSEPKVLEDLSTIKWNEGDPAPKVGDKIYTFASLPEGKCGMYWVMDTEGFVSRVAVCTGDHEGGH